ncbi:MAG: hypothetical protein JO356_01550 [Acidobacteria bacterium]|nr:hypothetical protein [Acidobacteriota bacterium]
MNSAQILVLLLVVVVIVAAGSIALARRKRRSQQLRERFGPEYDRVVSSEGDVRKGERVLEFRQKHREKLNIRSLSPNDRASYMLRWNEVQARFVDDPRGAVTLADSLVTDVMQSRGYPIADFEQRAADVSVDHPLVVDNYRAAHDIALRQGRGQATTEDLRKAMVHYRSLFEQLLGENELRRKEA